MVMVVYKSINRLINGKLWIHRTSGGKANLKRRCQYMDLWKLTPMT